MKPKSYDIIVIGSGAGAKIARPAAQKGLKTAIIEKGRLGGTCLNRGCIPSKMLIHPADVAREILNAKKFNINVDTNFKVNFSKLTKRINDEVHGDSDKIKHAYESGKIKNMDFYDGEAKFVKDKVIEVNGKRITAEKIIIAVGARPNVPPIPGLKETPYWTSTQALQSKSLPNRLIVVGGGYIGVELGHAFGSLGSNVHFMTRGGFVGMLDEDIREEFSEVFNKRYKVHEGNTQKVSYDKSKKEFTITYKDQEGKTKNIKADNILVATGVKPNNDLLGLENTSIKINERGFLKVNKHLETSVKGVYALGDCAGNYMFRHSANFEAEYLFDKLVEDTKKPISYPPMPWAIFTNPQVAGVGMSEKQLQEKGVEYIVGKCPYIKSGMGQALLSEEGFVKLLFDKKTQKLLGASILGEQASIMIHMCIVFITQKAKLDDFFKVIYIHPAMPEIIRNAARDAKMKFESF